MFLGLPMLSARTLLRLGEISLTPHGLFGKYTGIYMSFCNFNYYLKRYSRAD